MAQHPGAALGELEQYLTTQSAQHYILLIVGLHYRRGVQRAGPTYRIHIPPSGFTGSNTGHAGDTGLVVNRWGDPIPGVRGVRRRPRGCSNCSPDRWRRPLVVFVDDLDRCSPGMVARVIEAIEVALPALRSANPRESKRYVNLFRFYSFITLRQRMEGTAPGDARLAALAIRWPDLLGPLGQGAILGKLEEAAAGHSGEEWVTLLTECGCRMSAGAASRRTHCGSFSRRGRGSRMSLRACPDLVLAGQAQVSLNSHHP